MTKHTKVNRISDPSSVERKSKFDLYVQERCRKVTRIKIIKKPSKIHFKTNPHQSLELSSDHLSIEHECQICLVSTEPRQLQKAFECDHEYCQSCITTHTGQRLKIFSEVICPNENCKKSLNKQSQFFKNLSQKDHQKLRKIQRIQYVNNHPQFKLCPIQDCEGLIPYIEGQTIFCPDCGMIFCYKCTNPIHDGQCEASEIEYLERSLQYKRCFQCRRVLERIRGCNHMTCICKNEFCYVCGQRWTDDHYSCYIGQAITGPERARIRQEETRREQARRRDDEARRRQRQARRREQQIERQNRRMAELYGTEEQFGGMENLLRMSEEVYFQQIYEQQIMEEEANVALAMDISMVEEANAALAMDISMVEMRELNEE